MNIHRTVVIFAFAATQLANCVPLKTPLPLPSEVPFVIDADYYYGPQLTQPPQEVPAPNFSKGPLKYPPSSPQRDAPHALVCMDRIFSLLKCFLTPSVVAVFGVSCCHTR